MAEFPAPTAGIALTHFMLSKDVDRSLRFYAEVLGGELVLAGEPSIVALANGWVIINLGGGPTDDKPTVTLESPRDPDRVSSFLNIRVADIAAIYRQWSARGAEFLTPPVDHGREIRCYLRDPDGHLIEVGQATGLLKSTDADRWASVEYVLSTTNFVRRDGDGNVLFDTRTAHAEPRPSDVLWSEPFPPHSLENVGDAELRVIMIELKDHR
jgi:catechol 2,3-dioxygenase-like lactoylglutathione lyase family enzyme